MGIKLLNVYGRTIRITRGDTAYISLDIKIKNRDVYKLSDNDKVYFTVKQSPYDDNFLFQKVLDSNSYIDDEQLFIHIEPSDTANLCYGKYLFDVQLIVGESDVYTIIPPSLFEIMPEITFPLNEIGGQESEQI